MLTLAFLLTVMTIVSPTTASPQDAFLQYGAIGALLVIALYTIKMLYQRLDKAHERDRERADKATEQLNQLNQIIREQIVVQLTRATDAQSRVTELLTELRHDRDR